MAETKKTSKKKTEAEKLEDDIEVFEPVAKSVSRTLEHPETGEKRTFSQHEMGFMTKLKFYRLLSGTLRLAVVDDQVQANSIQGIAQKYFGGDVEDSTDNSQMIKGLLKLVELSPDFIEEAYVYALNAKPKDREWLYESLDSLSDDEGIDILRVFVLQNGESIKDFFTEKLPKLWREIESQISFSLDTEQE